MTLTWLSVAAAAAGGYFGALLGALVAFVFCGIAILVGVAVVIAGGDVWFLNHIALGEWFGPHVSFAGGVAAAAFAARRGSHDGGRDIVSGFVGRGDPVVLAVGAVFGVVGLLVQQGLASIDWFDAHTDTVALGVVVSAVIARLVFGRTGLLGTPADTSRSRLATTDAAQWLPFQEKPLQAGLLGLFAGLLSAWVTIELGAVVPDAAGVVVLIGFAISAVSLLFLTTSVTVPVTHHITLVAAVAAVSFGNVWIGALFGVVAGLVGELASRLMLIHGDTHIDPPAVAIALLTPVVMVMA